MLHFVKAILCFVEAILSLTNYLFTSNFSLVELGYDNFPPCRICTMALTESASTRAPSSRSSHTQTAPCLSIPRLCYFRSHIDTNKCLNKLRLSYLINWNLTTHIIVGLDTGCLCQVFTLICPVETFLWSVVASHSRHQSVSVVRTWSTGIDTYNTYMFLPLLVGLVVILMVTVLVLLTTLLCSRHGEQEEEE